MPGGCKRLPWRAFPAGTDVLRRPVDGGQQDARGVGILAPHTYETATLRRGEGVGGAIIAAADAQSISGIAVAAAWRQITEKTALRIEEAMKTSMAGEERAHVRRTSGQRAGESPAIDTSNLAILSARRRWAGRRTWYVNRVR